MSDQNNSINLTPREIVSELDSYIIGQNEAKRAVAIALRNRWRRKMVEPDLREDIAPKNIIMAGPTGVGKTEIARRLAKLAKAPFVKVEATKFTEVGYVGKDVESMIRDLADISINMVREEEMQKVQVKAAELAEERLLDILLPKPPKAPKKVEKTEVLSQDKEDREGEEEGDGAKSNDFEFDLGMLTEQLTAAVEDSEDVEDEEERKKRASTREKFRKMLREGKLDKREIELDPSKSGGMPMVEVVAGGSMDEIGMNLRDMLSNMLPRGSKRRKVKVSDALQILTDEEAGKLIDTENVKKLAIDRAEQSGIVFLDEIDKIASPSSSGEGRGPDVSRSGVQRDILPIIEGSTVNTKHGMVKTDHILFIAAGAFHTCKPSDLMPELQGRFPIRVELNALNKNDFLRILKEPTNSLTKQYVALMGTESVKLDFTDDGIDEIAEMSTTINERLENIGARRLHTILEKILDDISFVAPDKSGSSYTIDRAYVKEQLKDISQEQDLSKYIL